MINKIRNWFFFLWHTLGQIHSHNHLLHRRHSHHLTFEKLGEGIKVCRTNLISSTMEFWRWRYLGVHAHGQHRDRRDLYYISTRQWFPNSNQLQACTRHASYYDFKDDRWTRWKSRKILMASFLWYPSHIRCISCQLPEILYYCGIIVQLFCLYKPAERLMTVDYFLESSTSMSAEQLYRCSTFEHVK